MNWCDFKFIFQPQKNHWHSMATDCQNIDNIISGLLSGVTYSRDELMSNNLLRISSFSKFPTDVDIFTTNLSKAGFYYTGRNDEVRCYSCGFTHKHWKFGDHPLHIHKLKSPSCAHVKTLISIHASKSSHAHNCNPHNLEFCSISRATDSFSSAVTSIRSIPMHTNLMSDQFESKKGVCSSKLDNLNKLKYPAYESLPVRINSFKGAPKFLEDAKYEMAAAGFMYRGYEDHTTCFFCGGGLRNWKAGDDPWIEHARWFPNCSYLNQKKGDESIRTAIGEQDILDENNYLSTKSSTTLKSFGDVNTHKTKVEQLIEENRQLKEDVLCKICLHSDVSIVFIPCGHMCCGECKSLIRELSYM